ncbi:MAG TPA: hypothetical protein DEG17_02340 [Cyanobacteria bacterium UBA11149]|nr:hypothetical protein [Cyanobacteria bacterium UBA11367]HBE58484.1 hypothetical protein [Cyanobacteria bacterium UBA11366]HBK65010.1 hypothetical protein [Cyanobacteria bacterium UBA11166]HBR75017.1 hypothetical protein [Cyanobacteria bacterium UBA11159]HBS68870.1 hypothetical protein [Cyanobacteria bacterium UBA11153]HBW87745.1 hypothetical protein [Cyanobacteria bacterium UBA11149]HCA98060.1 hypothetical protein [Cyanobacteria bacterium UBA9226]
MESLDDLLAQIKSEYQEPKSTQTPKKKSLFDEAEFAKQNSSTGSYQPPPPSQTWLSPAEENLLAELKAEFKQQEEAEELKKQEQIQEEKRLKEQQLREQQLRNQQREQKRREALTQQATEWLKKLNPKSEEGLWFEEFSYSYPSKLEAAIDYMQALRETSLDS